MCIKIVKLKEEVPYDTSIPLEEQLVGSRQIVVNYEPKDSTVDKFLDEVERMCKNGVSASLNIKFNHNNYLAGARIKKEMRRLAKDLDVNELIKAVVSAHSEADKKLEEMAQTCLGKRFNE